MISKTNATIPMKNGHFGGQNFDSKLDLESNIPEMTNLTLNERYFFMEPSITWLK